MNDPACMGKTLKTSRNKSIPLDPFAWIENKFQFHLLIEKMAITYESAIEWVCVLAENSREIK